MYHFGKKNYAKNLEAQSFINQYKTVTPILVIDKRFEKPTPHNLPKNIYEKLPKTAHIRKMPIVKAKVGPQILTLMCDKNIYDVLAVKKTVKVELAGIYISKIVGMNLEDKKKKSRKRPHLFPCLADFQFSGVVLPSIRRFLGLDPRVFWYRSHETS